MGAIANWWERVWNAYVMETLHDENFREAEIRSEKRTRRKLLRNSSDVYCHRK